MGYQLVTNNQPRPLLSFSELPANARSDFDYIEDDDYCTPRFVKYRNVWYDANDTQRIEPDNGRSHPVGWAMRVHPGEPLAQFDSIVTDSYFSGVAFRFADHFESVVIAHFYS